MHCQRLGARHHRENPRGPVVMPRWVGAKFDLWWSLHGLDLFLHVPRMADQIGIQVAAILRLWALCHVLRVHYYQGVPLQWGGDTWLAMVLGYVVHVKGTQGFPAEHGILMRGWTSVTSPNKYIRSLHVSFNMNGTFTDVQVSHAMTNKTPTYHHKCWRIQEHFWMLPMCDFCFALYTCSWPCNCRCHNKLSLPTKLFQGVPKPI